MSNKTGCSLYDIRAVRFPEIVEMLLKAMKYLESTVCNVPVLKYVVILESKSFKVLEFCSYESVTFEMKLLIGVILKYAGA